LNFGDPDLDDLGVRLGDGKPEQTESGRYQNFCILHNFLIFMIRVECPRNKEKGRVASHARSQYFAAGL
jgi:hypothetical protein